MTFSRNQLLRADDDELAKFCSFDYFKASGNGGQKRNKTDSAVRATICMSEGGILAAVETASRSQSVNRHNALFKLRLLIAFNCRCEPELPERSKCAVSHPDYPVFCAALLDVLCYFDWDHKAAAAQLGISPSALVKTIARDGALLAFVNQQRGNCGKCQLKT